MLCSNQMCYLNLIIAWKKILASAAQICPYKNNDGILLETFLPATYSTSSRNLICRQSSYHIVLTQPVTLTLSCIEILNHLYIFLHMPYLNTLWTFKCAMDYFLFQFRLYKIWYTWIYIIDNVHTDDISNIKHKLPITCNYILS